MSDCTWPVAAAAVAGAGFLPRFAGTLATIATPFCIVEIIFVFIDYNTTVRLTAPMSHAEHVSCRPLFSFPPPRFMPVWSIAYLGLDFVERCRECL